MKIAVVLGTSKSDGNTRKLVEVFQASTDTTLFDLSDYAISFYDYEHMNRNDDFIHLINKLVEFDHLVFASPVYWYSMSAQLKVFFDRLSDLLTIEKELGRCLFR
ncbi:Putative NAD(P)H-dependent FMN-containing oxidoreductase YwqN [Vibrio cholerae]|nr:Putative NAD(P)H-dependent FMN-containing oxidoreductase YwqN [Vibrio cholerae]